MAITNLNNNKILPWILATRPKTLTAAFTPIFVATALSFAMLREFGGKISWTFSISAFFASIFIQIGTNLINDAIDFKKGADTAKRIGPKRVTQSGLLLPRQVLAGGFFSFIMAVFVSIPIILHGGLPIVMIGGISLVCGYLYTGGPYPLAYVGLGELFVILFFGLAAMLGVFYLQTARISLFPVIAGMQIGLLATVLISINNFRDYVGDRAVNKKTLAVRFGKKFARIEILLLYLFAYLLNIFWYKNGYILVSILPLITLPLAINVVNGVIKNDPSPRFNKYLGMSALVQILFGVLMGIGFII
jgi:1,4-dihydroxy-2-naphthoate octaprenyltransferase